MQIIGINGFKRSGKGETALAIQQLYDGGVDLVGFADKLKVMAARSLGVLDATDEQCIALMDEFKETGHIDAAYGLLPKGIHISGRQYLQHMGTQARNLFGRDFWVDQVLPDPSLVDGWVDHSVQEHLQLRYPDVDCLAITDVRFENEAKRIKRLGGVVWEITRPGTGSDGHDSEQVLPRELVDVTIDNDGDLLDLAWAVDKRLELMA